VRLPPFWPERPAVWFAQPEVQFFFAGISSEKTKFCHVISPLDQRYAAELEEIITSQPERDPYTTLRAELMRRLSPSREQRIRQFLTLEMGDHKPSQFLRHLRSLAPDVPEDFLHTIWSSRLLPTYGPFSLASMRAAWKLQPAARTASPRLHPSRRSLALAHHLTTAHFCRGSRASPARWLHSAPSMTVFTSAPKTLASAQGTLAPISGIPVPPPGTAAKET
jgi:hypothetical protein